MELGDARKLTQDAQESLRMRAVKGVIEDKMPCAKIGKLLGVARSTVFKWVATYRQQGKDGLHKKKRGRRSEDMLLLNDKQCSDIVKLIRDRCPDQLKLPFALWTREAVRDLVKRQFGITLAINTVGLYLKRWGFTPQKPLRRAYERQDRAVRQWIEEEYPKIAARARKEKAEIHWGDEAGFRSDHQVGTSFSPKGKTPVIKSTGMRFRANMISTITNHGKLRFMVFEETFTTDVFINFMKRLIHKAPSKIFLIVDNHKVHHSNKVREWIKQHSQAIEVFYLPSYSPELNPDELLNQDVKSNAVGRKRAKTKQELKRNLLSYLYGRQKSPHIVRSYFHKKEVNYAA